MGVSLGRNVRPAVVGGILEGEASSGVQGQPQRSLNVQCDAGRDAIPSCAPCIRLCTYQFIFCVKLFSINSRGLNFKVLVCSTLYIRPWRLTKLRRTAETYGTSQNENVPATRRTNHCSCRLDLIIMQQPTVIACLLAAGARGRPHYYANRRLNIRHRFRVGRLQTLNTYGL